MKSEFFSVQEGKYLRKALPSDAPALTCISFASKRHWNYPEDYFEWWRDELTITGKYIDRNSVFIYEKEKTPVAFFSLLYREKDLEFKGMCIPAGLWLDHMFVLPEEIGKGVGSEMFHFMQSYACSHDYPAIYLLADPFSEGFYSKMGCRKLQDFPSSIEGRTTPLMALSLGSRRCE